MHKTPYKNELKSGWPTFPFALSLFHFAVLNDLVNLSPFSPAAYKIRGKIQEYKSIKI